MYSNSHYKVDIEHLSKDSPETVNFSVKPQAFMPNGQATNTTFQQARPSFDLSAVRTCIQFPVMFDNYK